MRGALGFLLLAGCTHQTYYLDLPDLDLEPPTDLEERLRAFQEGREPQHGDPRAVADAALRRHLDVPWKADPFRPSEYEVRENARWGTYVVRGYRYPSGHEMRYRVKVRPYGEIWYPVQVSHYKIHELPHPALEREPGNP